jgi:hypothetical protein
MRRRDFFGCLALTHELHDLALTRGQFGQHDYRSSNAMALQVTA